MLASTLDLQCPQSPGRWLLPALPRAAADAVPALPPAQRWPGDSPTRGPPWPLQPLSAADRWRRFPAPTGAPALRGPLPPPAGQKQHRLQLQSQGRVWAAPIKTPPGSWAARPCPPLCAQGCPAGAPGSCLPLPALLALVGSPSPSQRLNQGRAALQRDGHQELNH